MVLSRVRALKGLFLCKPLSMDKTFKVDDGLTAFERRMEFLQESVLNKMDLSDAPLDDEDSSSDEEVGNSNMARDTPASTEETLAMAPKKPEEAAGCEVTTDVDIEVQENQVSDCNMDSSEERLTTDKNMREASAISEVTVDFDDLFLQEASLLPYMSRSDVEKEITEHKRFYRTDKSEAIERKAVVLLMEWHAFTYVMKLRTRNRLSEIHCWRIVFDKSSATGKWVREKCLEHATANFNRQWKRTSTYRSAPTVQDVTILDEANPADFSFDNKFIEVLWELRHTSLLEVNRMLNLHKPLYNENKSEYMEKKAVLLLMKAWAIRIVIDLSIRYNLSEQQCWDIILDDHSKIQWLMEEARKKAISNFKIRWKKVEKSTAKLQVNK